MKDYYAILEINESASKETIDKVHKLLVKRYHPDLQEATKRTEFEEKMKEVNEAYEVLTNPDRKKTYDLELKEYRLQKIMEEIREKRAKEFARTEQGRHMENENINNPISTTNSQNEQENIKRPFEVSDEEIRRQAQVYYDELYRQYLYRNGYIREDFKTVAKRYIAVILTLLVLSAVILGLYQIPYFNNLVHDIINSNSILKTIFGGFLS